VIPVFAGDHGSHKKKLLDSQPNLMDVIEGKRYPNFKRAKSVPNVRRKSETLSLNSDQNHHVIITPFVPLSPDRKNTKCVAEISVSDVKRYRQRVNNIFSYMSYNFPTLNINELYCIREPINRESLKDLFLNSVDENLLFVVAWLLYHYKSQIPIADLSVTIIGNASSNGHTDMLQLLFKNGANFPGPFWLQLSILTAYHEKRYEVIKILLRKADSLGIVLEPEELLSIMSNYPANSRKKINHLLNKYIRKVKIAKQIY